MNDQGKTLVAGVPRESFPGETRVAVTPAVLPALARAGIKLRVQEGAGVAAGYLDSAFADKGAEIVKDRAELFQSADMILQVRALGSNPQEGKADLDLFKKGQVAIGMSDPLSAPEESRMLAEKGVTAFSMEMMPRITRAQSMDVLSSMATIAGYKAVLLAADALPRMFPMLMTAAGTISPAHVLIVGAGVAGLQAIASAKRIGAKVEAYDIRPAVKEQIESLGATFVELPLETGDAEDKGGYAKAQDEEFYRKQRELMGQVVARSDVVITTAAVPGKKAPVLVTADMVKGMSPGSVIVDLAAERGGNCELVKPGEVIVEHGVTIIGPLNIPATIPYHASQMYGKNIATFLAHLVKKGEMAMDMEDEITVGTMISRDGEVVHPSVRELLGLENAPAAPAAEEKKEN